MPDPGSKDQRPIGGPSSAARFDDWAFWLSGGILMWICAYLIYYLFSGAWAAPTEREVWLRWLVGLTIGYRVVVCVVDLLRGQGPVVTRHPLLAFVDMLALGLMVPASVDVRQGSSPLAPLFLVFLAVVPILYRNIESRRWYVLFTALLVLEALVVFLVPATLYHREVYQRHREGLDNVRLELARLGEEPPPPAERVDLRALLEALPADALPGMPTVVQMVEDVEELAEEVDRRSPPERTLREVEQRSEHLLEGALLRCRSELEDKQRLLTPIRHEIRALRERLRLQPINDLTQRLLSDEPVFQQALDQIERTATRVLWRMQRALLLLEQRDLELRTDSKRILANHAFTAMILVLGFMVQFLIRRYVSRSIETARSRTFSEMLAERHRMDAQNWINLTAGLTHNIGNEIRGYDVFLEEILAWLDREIPEAPPGILEKLQFIYRTNQARLGFIQFLREFAILRQVYDEERPVPSGLRPLPLEPTLRRAHARVQAIETCYNPPESTDPGDVRKRQKFFETPLEIEHLNLDQPLVLERGREAVLDFFFYELLKNALRNCSGQVPLRARLERLVGSGNVSITIVNDLNVQDEEPGPCASCRTDTAPRLVVAARGTAPVCAACLRQVIEHDLEMCFAPGRGSGTGLGLFVIKHFLEEYYHGVIHCGIESWEPETRRFLVFFRLVIPDDLSRTILERNALWRATS
jgi:hypothetical protein